MGEAHFSIEDIIKANLKADLFIIGEFHPSYLCHVFQKKFIAALYKLNPRIIVGLRKYTAPRNAGM